MPTTNDRWFHRRGELAEGDWESVVDGSMEGWQHTGLRIAELEPGGMLALAQRGVERIVVPLSGSFTVTHSDGGDSVVTTLDGRTSVFDGPTDVLYLSCSTTLELRGHGRVAVAESPTDEVHPTQYIPAVMTPIELRGAGASSRQVHNFGTPQSLDAARLIVCEVLTPAENWSSYPPHKHDEDLPGRESRLEEIYYFEASPTVAEVVTEGAGAPFGLFSAYSSPAGTIDINAMVGTGDIALVPYGYHGPAVAAPGYDLYYLNVMAGPDTERVWLISDDPAHAWIRATWDGQHIDGRLPYSSGPLSTSDNSTTPHTKGRR